MAKLGRPAVAVGIMAVIIAALFLLCTPRSGSRTSTIDPSIGSSRDVLDASGGLVRSEIVDWHTLDEFPPIDRAIVTPLLLRLGVSSARLVAHPAPH